MKRVLRATLILVIPSFMLFYGWSSLDQSRREAASTYAWLKAPSWLPWPVNRWQPVGAVEMLRAGESLKRKRELGYQFIGLPLSLFPEGRPSELFTTAEIVREAVNQRVIQRQAAKMGLQVSQDELRAYIRSRFPQNTERAFAAYLDMRRISEAQYLEELSSEILNDKIMAMFVNQAKASLFELWQEYTLEKEKLQLDCVKILASKYVDTVAIDEQSLQSFFNERIEDYRVPDQRRYRYISVSYDEIKEQTEVTLADAQAYYNENVETHPLLRTSPKVKIRQITLQQPKTEALSEEEKLAAKDEVRKRMSEILVEARDKNTDFAELANRLTEDPNNVETLPDGQKALKGGDVGWIGEDQSAEWGQLFIDTAMGLTEDGQISDILTSPKGFHILKREGFEESQPRPFEEVADVAREAAQSKIVREELDKRIEAMRQAAKESTGLAGLAAKLGYEVRQTELLSVDDTVIDPRVGPLSSDKDYLATLESGELSGVLTTERGALCATVQESIPSRLPELSEVRERVELDFRNARALEITQAKAEEGEKQAQSPQGFETWAESEGLEIQTTEAFERVGAPPGFNEKIDDLPNQTYKTPVGAVRASTLSLGGQPVGWIVWRIKDVQMPTQGEFAKDYNSFQRQHVFTKQWALYEEWLADARQKWQVRLPERKG